MQLIFNASQRQEKGTGASRRLRRSGRIPGILYGGDDQPCSISMDHNELYQLLRKEVFYSSVLSMSLDGNKQQCLLRDVHRHPYKQLILHLDFQRIDPKQVIHQKIPLHFINGEISPGVKLGGGLVQHIMTELDVRCLPKDLPGYIEIDLKDLNTNQSLHLSQINLPNGVTANLHKQEDPVIATIVAHGAGSVEEEQTDTPETEVISSKAEKKE